MDVEILYNRTEVLLLLYNCRTYVNIPPLHNNRCTNIEGGNELTTCPILYKCPANSDWLIQVSAVLLLGKLRVKSIAFSFQITKEASDGWSIYNSLVTIAKPC